MKELLKILKDNGLLPILQRRVESKSNPGTFHVVSLFGDGHMECECTAGIMKNICGHQKKFIKWIVNYGKRYSINSL